MPAQAAGYRTDRLLPDSLRHFFSCNVGLALCVPTIRANPSGSTTAPRRIAPKHVHYLALGCYSETHSLGDYFGRRFPRRETGPLRSANGLSAVRLPSAGFSGPSIKVVPRNVSSAWMGLPSGPFMMPHLEKPRVPARGPHADSANSAASRVPKTRFSYHDARYNDLARWNSTGLCRDPEAKFRCGQIGGGLFYNIAEDPF